MQFLREERLAFPMGAIIGAVTGFLNERWRPIEDAKDKEDGVVGGFGAEHHRMDADLDNTAGDDSALFDAFRSASADDSMSSIESGQGTLGRRV